MAVVQSNVAEEFARSIELIRIKFLESLPKTIEKLDNLLTRIEDPNGDVAALTEAAKEVHRIAGVAGTLGFPDLGDLSKEAEVRLIEATKSPQDSQSSRSAVDIVDRALEIMSDISDD